jgi:hypothetical protein
LGQHYKTLIPGKSNGKVYTIYPASGRSRTQKPFAASQKPASNKEEKKKRMSLNALQSMERAISSMTLKLFEKKKSG